MSIRAANRGDVSRIKALVEDAIYRLGSGFYTIEQLDAWASGLSESRIADAVALGSAYVADIDGIVAAYGQVDRRNGLIDMLYVDPDYAHRGLGTEMLDYLERLATDEGCHVFTLRASLNALDFYKSRGYKEHERVNHKSSEGIDIPCVDMVKVV